MSKRHSEQFKQQVLQHALSHPEQTKVSIAHSFGLGHSTLDKWMRAHHTRIGAVASAALTADQQSILALKRENAHLREVNEILKKAHVYFVSNPSLSGTRI